MNVLTLPLTSTDQPPAFMSHIIIFLLLRFTVGPWVNSHAHSADLEWHVEEISAWVEVS